MSFGPADIGTALQGIGALAQAAAIVIAACLASNTFNSWRKQKLAERRSEQAERILTATYKVRRGLSRIRNPFMLDHELYAAEEKLKADGKWPEYPGEQRRMKTQLAYYNRLNATLEDRVELEQCQPMARALFGEDIELAIETLNRQANLVQYYVDAKALHRELEDRGFYEKIDAAIYEGYPYDAPNEMDETIAAQVRQIEDRLVPVLRLEVERS